MARDKPVIWVACEVEYFSGEDWTGQISLICHDKSGFRRIGFCLFAATVDEPKG
jgi:hypothetical protein